jgi:gamma-glutamyltranspeptidase
MAQLSSRSLRSAVAALVIAAFAVPSGLAAAQKTNKPVLHGQKWVAITGKPLGATAGAMIFQKGGNAVDAACAMLAAVATMWDVLSWGGETQALIYDPIKKKVIGVNALGVAPTGATPELFRKQKLNYPPEYGALAAVTPGTPGGLFAMLAEYGTMSLADVLAPAIALAEGYPIEQGTADSIERNKDKLKQWPYARATMLPHLGKTREAPDPGELFRQPELAGTLKKLVEAEGTALRAGKNRKQAIYAAHERFYKGDIAQELVRGAAEQGGLITMADLAGWKVRFEEPVATTYRGIAVYKLTTWTQGPAMLQALNILEGMDLKAMGYNTTRYIHALYQAMSLAFADRDFYYGDPYSGPEEPIRGLLSKDYARQRAKQLDWTRNNAAIKPGDPYPFQKQANPFKSVLERWGTPQEHTGGPVTTGTHQGPVTSAPPSAAAGGSGAIASALPNQLPLPLPFDDEYLQGRHHVDPGRRRQGLGRLDHPERRLGPRRHRRQDRRRPLPAHAELRPRRQREPVQRRRPRPPAPRHAHAHAGAQGRQAVPLVRRAGRRHSGSEPAAVLPQHRRVRHERAAGHRGRQHRQLPDA